MTGEITLRGKVLAIGGLKEKVLAAHRFGIRTIIIPKDNEKDLADVPPEVQSELDFKLVETMEDVLRIALERHPAPASGPQVFEGQPIGREEPKGPTDRPIAH